MSSNKKKSLLKSLFTSNTGCGCGKLKQSDIHQPKPKPLTKPPINPPNQSISSSSNSISIEDYDDDDDQDQTSTTFSLTNIDTTPHCSEQENDPNPSKTVSPCPKICNSLAIEKDSDDPYNDFRQSMLQMILEREIYSKNELQELLKCFLKLNSPTQHDIIVKAFMEIWNGVISKR